MQIDHIHKTKQVLFVRLVKVDAEGKRQYHRTSFDRVVSPRVMAAVEADLESKGWGRMSDMDRTLVNTVVGQLFTPEVEPEPERPEPMLRRTWKSVRRLLGVG